MTKKCFRCGKKIEENENYYAFTEFDKGKEVSTDYAHRKCWDDFLEGVSTLQNAQNLLGSLKTKLQGMGMIGPDVVEVKA